MNGIIRKTDAKSPRKNGSGVNVGLIQALQSDFARELWRVSSKLWSALMEPTHRVSEEYLREIIADGEVALANPQVQWLLAELKLACLKATQTQIRHEVGMLLLAFPTKDDLSAFVEIAVAELGGEPVSRLRLATACRNLRRTARFRPSIAEMLEAISDLDRSFEHVGSLLKLPENLKAVRQRLAQGNFKKPVQARITSDAWAAMSDEDL